jgi:spermidine/putrescine transport system permease protein
MGLVYGYIPFFILPLYAALDRIDGSVLEASRDLGANRVRTFWHVTLPLSRHGLLAAAVITALPMFGDYYTTDLLSASPKTTMIGNQIRFFLNTAQVRVGAALVVVLSLMLLVLMAYYLISTARASREAAPM